MANLDPCEICDTPSENVPTGGFDGVQLRCPRCGEYKLSGTACSTIRRVSSSDRTKLSAWVFEQSLLGEVPTITDARLQSIAASPIPGLVERANRMLLLAIQGLGELNEHVNLFEPRFLAATFSKDQGELSYLANFLEELGWIHSRSMGGGAGITPDGYIRTEELRRSTTSSTQCFVAMWFPKDGPAVEEMRNAYERGLEPGVRSAGFDPILVNAVEHAGKIDDEIIAQIRKSRFVVADFTGQRQSVYFEAGYAQGLNLPVLWTCHEKDIDDLHFDVRQYNCIMWTDPAEMAERLTRRIEAVIGEGPGKIRT